MLEDSHVLEYNKNHDLKLIRSWLAGNKSTLNIKKTKFMLIDTPYRLSRVHDDFITAQVNKNGFKGYFNIKP